MLLNPKAELLHESLTIKLNTLANKLISEGKSVVNLTAGELNFPTPKYIQTEVKKNLHLNKYTPTLGAPSLREKIAKKIYKDYKWKVSSKNVGVTAGGKQALYECLFAILTPKDEVIVLSPDWVTYRYQIILNDATPVVVPLNENFDLDIIKIKKAISKKTKAIILNSPNNPTGSIYSKATLLKLKKLLKGKNIYLIVDDIYSKIIYDKTYKSPAIFAPDKEKLILINGFSKSQALTGWRIGYVVASEAIIKVINSFQSHTTGNTSLLSQIAAEKILDTGDQNKKFISGLKKQRALTDNLLRSIPKISYKLPSGAFYFFIDISKIEKDGVKFCETLLKKGLALVPGEAFGRAGYVRLSFSAGREKITKGIKILKTFCEKY